MKNVYKVTFDVRIGRHWLGAGNPNGWSSRNVIANGDARVAADKVVREEMKFDYDGVKPSAVRVLEIIRVAQDVLQ